MPSQCIFWGVLVISVITNSRVYSLAASLVSVLIFSFLFTDPRLSLNAYEGGYPVTFIVMLVSALFSSTLAVKIKRHARQSAAVAFRTKILFETNQLLQRGKGREEIVSVTGGAAR